ncbi:MAG: hypothetical protein ACREMD_01210 [Gemmatimonadota bacterium]
MTGPERTLVEGFHYPEKVGDLEELVISASGFAGLNLQVLEDLLEAYDRKILWAAVGWFLARYRRAFNVPGDFLRRLERHVPRSPQYLPRRRRGQGGVLVRPWNLILPESVLALGEADGG